MLLAARALGPGALDAYLQFEKEWRPALGLLPSKTYSYPLLPIGYPMGRFRP
jgi:hypothetical protein